MLHIIRFISLATALLTFKSTFAQDIEFNKKSGAFTSNGTTIALLKSEKEKYWGKTYLILDAAGEKELLSFKFQYWEDTLGSPMEFYYKANCTILNKHVFRPNFTNSMNTFKEVGEYVLEHKLLNNTGTLNEENTKILFDKLAGEFGNYDDQHQRITDSLVHLITIPSDKVERDTRKPIIANEYGKIGQDNTVIAQWELISFKGKGFNASEEYVYFIKNNAGGIIAVSWINLSGAKIFTYKNGVRSREIRKVLDLVNANPVNSTPNKIRYIEELSKELFKAGLL